MTTMLASVWPGAKVMAPVSAIKSTPGVALPLLVAGDSPPIEYVAVTVLDEGELNLTSTG
jgi:hypothetical protein